jgi:GTPase Era involved in 16S rRNA processing
MNDRQVALIMEIVREQLNDYLSEELAEDIAEGIAEGLMDNQALLEDLGACGITTLE